MKENINDLRLVTSSSRNSQKLIVIAKQCCKLQSDWLQVYNIKIEDVLNEEGEYLRVVVRVGRFICTSRLGRKLYSIIFMNAGWRILIRGTWI